ncbi:SigE family RNA polymerase sigma factor [Streptomyces chattanoogensis]|uniref:SigE family RNA polymerase sigma factor n=1 Tax=Streptomyces chattanoogensis TaxID=66876 RepID=UPI0005D8DA9E|nr:RNA polymerase sigma-E factor [Streptomyces lydicus]
MHHGHSHGQGHGPGRDEAFSAFMASRYPSLLRTATLLTGTATGAEDLAQEALLRTYRAWRRIGRIEAAEAYTRTTMARLLAKDRRRRWSQELPAEQLPEVPGPGHDEWVATAVSVRAVLRQLPPAQRAVLVLRYYHQLTERQIAEALGCSVGTVKSRAARALSALRDAGFLTAVTDREKGAGDE